MWGSPGSLIAAHAMLEWTGDGRWRDGWNESAEALWTRRDGDGLWVQRLYGQEYRSLTPPHGLVGNVQALLPHIDAQRSETLKRDANAVLARTAVRDDGLANWPPRDRPELPGPDGQIRVQWCAGAPGIVIGAADYLDDDLLLNQSQKSGFGDYDFVLAGRERLDHIKACIICLPSCFDISRDVGRGIRRR